MAKSETGADELRLQRAIRMRDESAPGTMSFALWNAEVKRLRSGVRDYSQAEHSAALRECNEWRKPWPGFGFEPSHDKGAKDHE